MTKFWEVESVGDTSVDCVIHKFEKYISHNGTRYVTKLPFRPDHDEIPDNYAASKGRIKSLKRRLGDNKDLYGEYDKVFKDYEESWYNREST